MKKLLLSLAALGLVAGSAPSLAAACRDKAGKYFPCPAKPALCRDKAGKFVKCAPKPKICRNAMGHYARCR